MEGSRDAPSGEINSLLGRGTEFTGKLVFDGKVRIDGIFRGEIASLDTLVIGETGEIEAEIRVAVVIVRGGTVRGNIRAREAVEVYAPGRIYGNITSPEVFIDKGVVFEGQCRMVEVPDDEPAEVAADGPAPAASKPAAAGTDGNDGDGPA
jgi:cytoskeletal protein CcmA (bactofilin family)